MPNSGRVIAGSLVAALVAIGGLVGCHSAKSYPIQIDAITKAKGETGTAYALKIKGPQNDDSLRNQEVVNDIKTALAGRGMYEAPANAKPDVIIEVEYGVTEQPAVRQETTQVPVYARKGGGMRYEQVEVKDAMGNITQRTVPVVDPPHAETIGYEERLATIPIFEKYIKLSARENVPAPEGRTTPEVWSVNASIETEGRDLRPYLPELTAAAMDAVAADSKNLKTVNVKDNSKDVGFVKKGL